MRVTWLFVLIASSLLAQGLRAETLFAAGTDLRPLVGDLGAHGRFGLDGAPPGPLGAVPKAPAQPGAHWLVAYDGQGAPVGWFRFDVAGVAESARALPLVVDRTPPRVSLEFEGEQVERAGVLVLGPAARPRIEAEDASGVVAVTLLAGSQELVEGPQWATTLEPGEHALAVRAVDRLGNAGSGVERRVAIDRTPPSLHWSRVDRVEGVPEDVYDGRRAELEIEVRDAGAGPKRLSIGDNSFEAAALAAGPVTLRVRGDALVYRVEDAVGNVAEGRIALRADRDGPHLRMTRNGEPLPLGELRGHGRDVLRLEAVDALSGVERACVEASIWYGRCRELPIDLVGIAPGRYPLVFKAADRLGNRRFERLTVEVLP